MLCCRKIDPTDYQRLGKDQLPTPRSHTKNQAKSIFPND